MPQIHFGIFEVDTRSGELRRDGSRVKLQEQPFQVLALLLERPGEVVTREELTKRLWPDNTFVDFERGLNKAINKLREALRDHPDKPRFIETLPHRGYRFIAQVTPPAPAPADSTHDHPEPQDTPRIDSLAVLPLENLSGDPAQEYFSDGMTEELITAVSKIVSLRVISRTSAMTYKGTHKSLPVIARELHVDGIIEGSVSRSDEKVRITAQLIYAPEDRHLWAGRYERDLSGILQLQAEIADNIAAQIQKVVDPAQARRARVRQLHPQAYEAWLKGCFFRDQLTPEGLLKSLELFTQAIELDPNYAQAYSDLSRTYFYFGLFGIGQPRDVFPKARANAVKALQLDETVAAAHNALAVIHILYDWDWARAEAEVRRGVELCPGDPSTHSHLADYMSITGRHDEAIAAHRHVIELDPISRVFRGHFGLMLYRARRYDEAIEQCQKALDIDPNYGNALWFMALSLEQKGRLPEAIAKLEQAVTISEGPIYLALLGRAYALLGERAKALDILDKLKTPPPGRYVSPFDVAVVYLGLDDRTSAFEWLEEAYQQRVFRIIELILPMFDNLRPDPRWQDLVHRIGLPTNN